MYMEQNSHLGDTVLWGSSGVAGGVLESAQGQFLFKERLAQNADTTVFSSLE